MKTITLLIRKNIILNLWLLALLLPMVSRAQSQSLSRIISWSKPSAYTIGDTIFENISFEGALYSGIKVLPIWDETFFIDTNSDSISIDNCIFIPLSDEEQVLMQEFENQVTTELSYTSKTVISQKQNGVHIEILPFIRDKATNQVMKLYSFRIQLVEQNVSLKSSVQSYVSNSVLSQGNWYKLGVIRTGIHQVGYNDLVAMGINLATLNPAKIGIYSRGGIMLPEANSAARADDLPENAIEVTGQSDGSFDKTDQILFYGQGPVTWQFSNTGKLWEHTSHLYADTVCYFLTTDRGSGKRISLKESLEATETDIVDSYDYYTFYEENNLNLIKSGRQWFAQIFDIITERSFPFELPSLASDGEVKVRSVTAASSTLTSTFEFRIGSQSWGAIHSPISTYKDSPVATGSITYKSFQSVTLPLKIEVRYNKTTTSAVGYLDLMDVNARCKLRFTGGQLDFRDIRSSGAGHIAKFRVGEAAGKARLWEVTDLLKVAAINSVSDGNDLVFTLSSDTIRQFVAFDENQLLKPHFTTKIHNQDLHALTGADMIILAPQAFMPQAVRLATFHSNVSDLNVLVLDPVTIYNEFSSGTTDITAIRDFLKMLYDKSPPGGTPKYLLLFGDASYDYKDKISSNTNFVPTWQSPESFSPISSLVSDDYYGMLDSNEGLSYADLIDLGIGRLPVKTPEEAEQAVDKIINYSVKSEANSGDWQNIITFVADDEDLNEHIFQAEQMAQNIENNYPDINLDKIYLDSYVQIATPGGNRYPDANKAITQRVEKGCLILNYTGHGGETGLAHEQVVTVSEINNWSNFDNLPVFVTATCEFSRFDDPGRTSAGEMVFINPKGGGIGLFTTTRPTYGSPNFELNKKFYQYAMSPFNGIRISMGDIIMNSKRDKGANENGRKYVLLGDPALQIDFPALNIITSSVNGHVAGAGADTLKAYMEVTIEGFVADYQGNLVPDFNGTVFPSVFDKSSQLKTLANDGGAEYSFMLRKNLLYKGTVNVVGGKFSFTFIVPKDIAYRYDSGKVSYFATDGTRDASGYYSNIVVGGSSQPEFIDNNGPEINLYMNSDKFRDGGITDQNARLLAIVSDENGINTIGNGIGHDITAVLDGNTSDPFILNDFYQSDINTFKSGYIWFPFSMLSQGEHTLTVKVWDVFNNSSESEIHFVVYSSGEFVISKTYNYPNPFSEYTEIVFEHNQQNVEFATHAEIYSITGQLVRVIEQTSPQIGSVSSPIRWDGISDQGRKVPPGIYIYNLKVSTSGGLYSQTSGKMIFQK
ncbi:MAG: type IX secretion system sortase PorU [Bacteroidales bacterium]|nr:type IX secretion system sortase PorU [Bacteroidales bacterium]